MDRQAPLLGKAHLRGPVHLWAIHTGRAQPGREEVGYLSWGWGGWGIMFQKVTTALSLSRTHASHEEGLQETMCAHTKVLRPAHTYVPGPMEWEASNTVPCPCTPPPPATQCTNPPMHVLSTQQGRSWRLPHHHKPRPVTNSETHPVGQQLLVTPQQESRPGNGSHASAHSSTSEISSSLNPKGQHIRWAGRDHRQPLFGSQVILKNVLILRAWGSPCHSPDQ